MLDLSTDWVHPTVVRLSKLKLNQTKIIMNARILLLAALIPAGLTMTSCSQRAHVAGGLGPDYKYRSTQYSTYEMSDYQPSGDGKAVNYFDRRNSNTRVAPLVQHGNYFRDIHSLTKGRHGTLHYHRGNKNYETFDGSYEKGNLYRHSHAGDHAHNHSVTPDFPN